jgi:hypothetical protein
MPNYAEHWEQLLDVYEQASPQCCSLVQGKGYIKNGIFYPQKHQDDYGPWNSEYIGYCDGALGDRGCDPNEDGTPNHACAVWCKAWIEINGYEIVNTHTCVICNKEIDDSGLTTYVTPGGLIPIGEYCPDCFDHRWDNA